MDAQEHYDTAMQLFDGLPPVSLDVAETLAAAQVHATLALVQASLSGVPVVFSDDVRQALVTLAETISAQPKPLEAWGFKP